MCRPPTLLLNDKKTYAILERDSTVLKAAHLESKWHVQVQEQIIIGGQIRKIVQHILQKRFDMSDW